MEQLVLEGLQRLMWYIQVYETQFAQEQMERFGLQESSLLQGHTETQEKDGIAEAIPPKSNKITLIYNSPSSATDRIRRNHRYI